MASHLFFWEGKFALRAETNGKMRATNGLPCQLGGRENGKESNSSNEISNAILKTCNLIFVSRSGSVRELDTSSDDSAQSVPREKCAIIAHFGSVSWIVWRFPGVKHTSWGCFLLEWISYNVGRGFNG